MVRAILNGNKTQTRRVITPPPGHPVTATKDEGVWSCQKDRVTYRYFACPYGQPGDLLWVREAWKPDNTFKGGGIPRLGIQYGEGIQWREGSPSDVGPWKPSIFMPKWGCRIRLNIEEIRVEPLRSITEADAAAEGVQAEEFGEQMPDGTGGSSMEFIPAYGRLWNEINAKRGFGWAVNPWVWVIKFRRIPS